MQLKVAKADGSIEEYLHTKVIATFNSALVLTGQADIGIAEQLAEALTYFLYHKQAIFNTRENGTAEVVRFGKTNSAKCKGKHLERGARSHRLPLRSRVLTSSEIHSMIQAVLMETTYQEAAVLLSEHHFKRQLNRHRIKVVNIDMQDMSDVEMLSRLGKKALGCPWDKSRIVNHLLTKHNFNRQTARTIASMVEEKVMSMGITVVPRSLIKQLVLAETAAILRAAEQLQSPGYRAESSFSSKSPRDMGVYLVQQRKGLSAAGI